MGKVNHVVALVWSPKRYAGNDGPGEAEEGIARPAGVYGKKVLSRGSRAHDRALGHGACRMQGTTFAGAWMIPLEWGMCVLEVAVSCDMMLLAVVWGSAVGTCESCGCLVLAMRMGVSECYTSPA